MPTMLVDDLREYLRAAGWTLHRGYWIDPEDVLPFTAIYPDNELGVRKAADAERERWR